MEHLRKLIKEALSTPLKGQCGCGCGCDDMPDKGITLNESIAPKEILSENLNYHIKNKLPLTENTFRYGSKAFLDLWAEARALYLREIIHVNEDDKQIIEETNLGNFGLYEGKEVALDLPMLEEVEMTNSLSLRANEIPLMKLMSRVIDNNGKDSPLYKDLETEFKKDTIDNWLYAIVYKSDKGPFDLKTTKWYDLVDAQMLPNWADKSILARGLLHQKDLILPWLDKSLSTMASQ
jgi:hypothetical protein